jgi:uncharacterized membrane protein (DUF2068 family)
VRAKNRSHSHGDLTLLVIAVFKFLKGALLLTLAFGALTLLHKDVASEVEHWLNQLRIDPDNEFIGTLLSKLQLVHTKELKEMSALGAGYAGLFLVEGTGLLFRKRWAEWLTIVATGSLMPLEVYELIKQFTLSVSRGAGKRRSGFVSDLSSATKRELRRKQERVKAIRVKEFGGPEVLRLEEVPTLQAAPVRCSCECTRSVLIRWRLIFARERTARLPGIALHTGERRGGRSSSRPARM